MKQYVLDFLELFVGLRKTIVYLSIMAFGGIMHFKGGVSGESVMDCLKGVGIAFMGAAGVDHIGEILTAHLNAKRDSK